MIQSRPTNKTMKVQILNILRDGMWHGCSDFVNIGLSYRNRISELRKEGYKIKSEREGKHPTYRYKLISSPQQRGIIFTFTPPPLNNQVKLF